MSIISEELPKTLLIIQQFVPLSDQRIIYNEIENLLDKVCTNKILDTYQPNKDIIPPKYDIIGGKGMAG